SAVRLVAKGICSFNQAPQLSRTPELRAVVVDRLLELFIPDLLTSSGFTIIAATAQTPIHGFVLKCAHRKSFMHYPDRPRHRRTFVLTGVENRGASDENRRIVCFIHGQDGLLAVWGTVGVNTAHVDALEIAMAGSRPVRVECDWIEPSPWAATQYRHSYWVFED